MSDDDVHAPYMTILHHDVSPPAREVVFWSICLWSDPILRTEKPESTSQTAIATRMWTTTSCSSEISKKVIRTKIRVAFFWKQLLST